MSTTGSRTIEVTIDSKGETTVQTRGFAGSSCREASRFLEQALGERTAEQLTAEFHQQPAELPQRLKQQG
jgi:hypothetical protein